MYDILVSSYTFATNVTAVKGESRKKKIFLTFFQSFLKIIKKTFVKFGDMNLISQIVHLIYQDRYSTG